MSTFLTIPFTRLGPTSGPLGDGVQLGAITPAPAPICLTNFHTVGVQHVATYDVESGSTAVIVDDSTLIQGFLAGNSSSTWNFGDTTAGNVMSLLFDLTNSLSVGAAGVTLEVVTAGSFTGTMTTANVTVSYWNGSSWTTLTPTAITGNFNTAGLLQITFPQVPPVGVNPGNPGYPMNLPMGSAGIRPWLWVQFNGLTAVTTAAKMGGAWIVAGTGNQGYLNLTSIMNQTGAINPATAFVNQPGLVLPQVGDVFVYGSPNRFCKINERLFRSANNSYSKQWVYYNGQSSNGGWNTFPAGTLVDGGSTNEAVIPTGQQELDFTVSFLPPADWQSITLTDVAGSAHTGYFVGVQVTAAPTTPVPPAELVFSVSEIQGANVTGAPLHDGGTFNYIVMSAANGCPVASNFVIANATANTYQSLTIPANLFAYAAAFNLMANAGDAFVVVQTSGSNTPANNLSNGFFTLQGA